MVWFYKRDHVSLSIETRYDNATSDYVAVVVRPDGRQRPSALHGTSISGVAHGNGATAPAPAMGAGGPVHILPDGWPHKPPMM